MTSNMEDKMEINKQEIKKVMEKFRKSRISKQTKIDMESIEDKPVDPKYIEGFIVRAIDKKCYVEVISLVHNTIEMYLRRYLISNTPFVTEPKKWKILTHDEEIKSVIVLAKIVYILGLISEEIYDDIIHFNSKRNVVVHKLLKKSTKYGEVKKIVRLGRKIQLSLSPLGHSKKYIENELKKL